MKKNQPLNSSRRHLLARLPSYLCTSLAAMGAVEAVFGDISPAYANSGLDLKLSQAGLPEISLTSDSGIYSLSELADRPLLINFWATWCAPCRKEMPELSAVQQTLGGADLIVLTVATGPNPPAKIAEFFETIGVSNLPAHRDPRQNLARAMNVLGLPVTAILDRDGAEIARLLGDANWHSDSALAILRAVIAQEP